MPVRHRLGHFRSAAPRRSIALLLLVALLSLCYCHRDSSPSPWAALEHSMNAGAWLHWDPPSNSSFDWSSLARIYPVDKTDLRPLPAPRPAAIPPIQHRFALESDPESTTTTTTTITALRESRLSEVKHEFTRAWAAYRRFAWKHDALEPIAARGRSQFSGWATTLVDSLDTLWLMGLRDSFDEAVAAVATIDFGASSSTPRVNLFETNIRYLGGLLAAYDLSRREILLTKALEVGHLVYAGFDTENGMPLDYFHTERAKRARRQFLEQRVVSASPGTLSLELTRLSQLTGDPKFYRAADRVMRLFHQGQNSTKVPGMWPTFVSMSAMDVVSGDAFTMGANADSLYEYLPKMHQLLSAGDPKYESMARSALRTASSRFLFRPMLPGGEDVLLPGNVRLDGRGTPVLDPETEHLACFTGGMFALASRLFEEPGFLATGAKLAAGCAYAYRSFPTGIMPERFTAVPCRDRQTCPWNEARWRRARLKAQRAVEAGGAEPMTHLPRGIVTANDPRYLLRPEAVESVFYMYRLTGDTRWQDLAWDMFVAVRNGTRTAHANAVVQDVTRGAYPLPKEDFMESFWLSETLKYFYLVFSPPDIISLDDFVLNTEAHPFRLSR